MATLAELEADITRLRTVIAAAEGGQEVEMNGRRIRRGDLATLYQRLDTLEARRDRLAGARPSILRGVYS